MLTRYTCATTGEKKTLSSNRSFYLFNHIEVLGFEKGIERCVKRLELKKKEVIEIYYAIHAKKKPNQLAG